MTQSAGMIKTEDLADIIRKKTGIYINAENKGRPTFFKDELLLIIARLATYEEEAKANSDKDLVALTKMAGVISTIVVEKLLQQLTFEHSKEGNNNANEEKA